MPDMATMQRLMAHAQQTGIGGDALVPGGGMPAMAPPMAPSLSGGLELEPTTAAAVPVGYDPSDDNGEALGGDFDFSMMEEEASAAAGAVTSVSSAGAAQPTMAERIARSTLAAAAVERGIAVSLGHQLATGSAMRRLADAGATMITHLGNGMPNQVHRHDNQLMAGAALDALSAGAGLHPGRDLRRCQR